MPTTILKLTAQELKSMVNPANDPALFRFGTGDKLMSEAAVIDLIEAEENGILSSLPEHYRDILEGIIDGEILTHPTLGAAGAETSLQLSFAPVVADTLSLYLNYRDLGKPWEDRTRDDAMVETTDYTINETTGVITLTAALASGDSVWAEYQHDAGEMFTTVRDLVLKAARLELRERLGQWDDGTNAMENGRDRIDAAIAIFNSSTPPKGINEIDKVNFVVETRHNARKGYKLPFMRGAIG